MGHMVPLLAVTRLRTRRMAPFCVGTLLAMWYCIMTNEEMSVPGAVEKAIQFNKWVVRARVMLAGLDCETAKDLAKKLGCSVSKARAVLEYGEERNLIYYSHVFGVYKNV